MQRIETPDQANLPEPGNAAAREGLEARWKNRAERLAQSVEQPESGEQIQLLVFRLGREFYGFEVKHVFDIRLSGEITPIPRVPDWVVGLTTIRGRVLSVIDLLRFFKLPEGSPSEKNQPNPIQPDPCQVSVETPELEIAFLVDEVLSIGSISLSQLEEPQGVWGEMRPETVLGLGRFSDPPAGIQDARMMVINLPALLADPNLVINEKFL